MGKDSTKDLLNGAKDWRANMPELDVWIRYIGDLEKQKAETARIVRENTAEEGLQMPEEDIQTYLTLTQKSFIRYLRSGGRPGDFSDHERRKVARYMWKEGLKETGQWDKLDSFRDESHRNVLLTKMYRVLSSVSIDEVLNEPDYLACSTALEKRFGEFMERQRKTAFKAYQSLFRDRYVEAREILAESRHLRKGGASVGLVAQTMNEAAEHHEVQPYITLDGFLQRYDDIEKEIADKQQNGSRRTERTDMRMVNGRPSDLGDIIKP